MSPLRRLALTLGLTLAAAAALGPAPSAAAQDDDGAATEPAKGKAKTKAKAKAGSGGLGAYLRSLRLGLSYSEPQRDIRVRYTADRRPHYSTQCEDVAPGDTAGGDMACEAIIRAYGASFKYDRIGLYLEKPFASSRLLYWDYGVDFALRAYTGRLAPDDELGAPPLSRFRMELYGGNARAFAKLGLVLPGHLPDFFLIPGLGLQPLVGQVRINSTKRTDVLVNLLLQVQGEVVLVRAAGWAFSFLYSEDAAVSAYSDDKPIDGVRDVELDLVHSVIQFRLTTPLP